MKTLRCSQCGVTYRIDRFANIQKAICIKCQMQADADDLAKATAGVLKKDTEA